MPLFLFKTNFTPQKLFMSCLCLRHGAYLNSTSNVFTYWLTIFLGDDWFGFFLNKWGCIRSTPYWHSPNDSTYFKLKISRAYNISSVESSNKFRNLPITTFLRYRRFLKCATVILQPWFEYENTWGCSTEKWYNYTLRKKWRFPLRISSVNVAKSAGNCRFSHIYWRNP